MNHRFVSHNLVLCAGLALGSLLFRVCPARAANMDPIEASLAVCPTPTDSVHLLLSAYFFARADSVANRFLRVTEKQNGVDGSRSIDPLSLIAEIRLVQHFRDTTDTRPVLDHVERLGARYGLAPMQRAAVERMEGIWWFAREHPDTAELHFRRSMDILATSAQSERPEYAEGLIWLARSLRGRRRVAEAAPYIDQACDLLRRVSGADSDSLFDCLDYSVNAVLMRNDIAGALNLQQAILDHQKARFGPHSPRVAETLYRHSTILSGLGRTGEARAACEAALAICPEDAVLSNVVASLAAEDGDFVAAESLFRRTIELSAANWGADSPEVGMIRGNRAGALYALGRMDEAQSELEAILPAEIRKFGSNSDVVASDYDLRSAICLARGDTACARGWINESLATLEPGSTDHRTDRLGYEIDRAYCDWLSGRTDAALAGAQHVEAVGRERLRSSFQSLSDQDALSMESISQSGLALALSFAMADSSNESTSKKVLDSAIRSRALVLDAVTSRNRQISGLADSTTRAIVDSLEFVRSSLARLAWSGGAPEESVRRLRWRERGLLAALAIREKGFPHALAAPSTGLPEVQSSLAKGSALLSYFRFNRRLDSAGSAIDTRRKESWYAGFMLSDDGRVRLVSVGPAARIDRQVARWRELANEPTALNAAEESEQRRIGDSLRVELYDRLRPQGERAYIVPDGALALLSFAALPRGDRFLIETEPCFSYLSSERDLVPASAPAVAAGGDFVLGNPDYERSTCAVATMVSTDTMRAPTQDVFRGKPTRCPEFQEMKFSPLAQSGAEARDVAKLLEQERDKVALLLGSDASEESFKKYAPGHRVIHVASHGFYLPRACVTSSAQESPLVRSGLVLAGANQRFKSGASDEDGILTAEEVATLDLRGTDCVVLSACESGESDPGAGEGVGGLRRAFYESGARVLVTALWQVQDASSRAWMRRFYQAYLGNRAHVAEAARSASLDMIRDARRAGRRPSLSEWGAYVVSGVPETALSGAGATSDN